MSDFETTLYNLILQSSHEQGSTKCHDVVNISAIPERIREACRGKSIDRIDCDLESLSKLFSRAFVIKIRCKFTIKHSSCLVEVLVFDIHTSIKNILVSLCVFTKAVHCDGAVRMQRCNIQQCDIRIHSRLGIYITTKPKVCTSVHVVTILKLILRERLNIIVVVLV